MHLKVNHLAWSCMLINFIKNGYIAEINTVFNVTVQLYL